MPADIDTMSGIGPDTPLRLKEAIRIKFPTGNITVAGLRSEARRGRLEIFAIANKDYTTLKALDEMIEACRRQSALDSNPGRPAGRSSASEIERAKASLAAMEAR